MFRKWPTRCRSLSMMVCLAGSLALCQSGSSQVSFTFPGLGCIKKFQYERWPFNPLTPTKKSSLIFVKNSKIIALGPRSSKLLHMSIYFFITEIWHLFYFRFFYIVRVFCEQFLPFFTVIALISLTVFEIYKIKFSFFNSAPYSVLKM